MVQNRISHAQANYDRAERQSPEIARLGQKLSDAARSIEQENLTRFTGLQPLDQIQDEIEQLGQMPLVRRGDISARLKVLGERIDDVANAIGTARSLKRRAEQTRQTLAGKEAEARAVQEAGSNPDLKEAFDEEFRNATKEVAARLHELQSTELWAIVGRQSEISAAVKKLQVLQQQVADTKIRHERLRSLDETRRSLMHRLLAAANEFSRPENHARLAPDGHGTLLKLKSDLGALSGLDNVPLFTRPDYSKMLTAADDTLKLIDQFRADMVHLSELDNGLRNLHSKVDERGRHLLDAKNSAQLETLSKSTKVLTAAHIPLAAEHRQGLADARSGLGHLESAVGGVMDREEKALLARKFPFRRGGWQFKFEKDNLTDEERLHGVSYAEGSQAKYELSIICGGRGPELLIATFERIGTESKRIPWNGDLGAVRSERIRLRIDSNPPFTARFNIRAYGNQGQVDIKAEFMNFMRSSRLVIADIFPEDQVVVSTAYPPEFRRLCELLGQPLKTARGDQREEDTTGLSSSLEKSPRNPDFEKVIEKHCLEEWGDNYRMRLFCVRKQKEAVQTLAEGRPRDVSDEQFASIRRNCAGEWSSDFRMRAYCERQQFQATRELNR